MKPVLEVRNLRKSFSSELVLESISFSVAEHTATVFIGASGSGKSTLLRCINLLEQIDDGVIEFEGIDISSTNVNPDEVRKKQGIVFQSFNLFPHMTVLENVILAPTRVQQLKRDEAIESAMKLLDRFGLREKADEFPDRLSGGQQQRVALARALAPAPSLLLLDEPFSSLDPELRERLALELRDLLKAAAITTLLVTHDQHEAFAIADRIGVMDGGRIAQWDTPYRLYHRPATREVADFVGHGAFLPGRVREADGRSQIEIELGTLPILARTDQATASAVAAPSGEVTVLLRPDDVVHDDASPVQAQVVRKAFRGAQFLYTLRLPSGATLLALVPKIGRAHV